MGRGNRGSEGSSGLRPAAPENSPWGEPDSTETLAEGVFWVSTPSHGGLMISKDVGDDILSEEAKKVGSGPAQRNFEDWYVFEEDIDWASAATDVKAAFNVSLGSLETVTKKISAEEIKAGYTIYDDYSGEEAFVSDVRVLEDGRIELALDLGPPDKGGKAIFNRGDRISVEWLVSKEGLAAEEPDASSRPLTNEEIKSLEAFEDEKYAKHLEEIAQERAEEIAEDRDQADWDSFSEEEKERRVSEAKEIISEEAVSRAEAAAEGETYTSHRRPADVSEALSRVAAGNDFLDLRTYGEYGVLSEMVSMYDPKESDFTEDQWKLARETVREIEAMASDMERRGDLGKTVFSEEGLRVAEAALREVAQGADGENISESMDPDRSFLFQTDEDHCLAMADYLSVLRTGKAGGGGGQGMSESWRERNADIADAARDAAKYA